MVNIVPGDYGQLIIDADATEGMSGGGVFNDQGDLMGIALGHRGGFEGALVVLTSTEINEVISELRAERKR